MKMLLLHIFLLCLLTGCITTTPVSPRLKEPSAMNWQARQVSLNTLKTWTIKGVVAIRRGDKGVNAHLAWQQQDKKYQLALFGPLGLNSVQLKGSPHLVELTTSNNQTSSASNPEALLENRTGWVLPVSNLYYWIRGLPAPGTSGIQRLDSLHRLSHLEQQGWQITYGEYRLFNQLDFPTKMELTRNQVQVRIIITQWENIS